MVYRLETKKKVEDYLRSSKSAILTELMYLNNNKRMQLNQPKVEEIVDDLVKEGLVRVNKRVFGKRKFLEFVWIGDGD